jgi:transcriptional regulator with XRE-family HTH domain
MTLLREVVGSTLRTLRMRQSRTLREVSSSARVSLGYLSEIERGQKEPSSELLAAICAALDVDLSDLFAEVSQMLRREEKLAASSRLASAPMAANGSVPMAANGSVPLGPNGSVPLAANGSVPLAPNGSRASGGSLPSAAMRAPAVAEAKVRALPTVAA